MDLQLGNKYKVTVTRILQRGIVVQFLNTSDTEFIHISKLSTKFVSDISKLVHVGDCFEAVCVKGSTRLELSLKHLNLESLYKNVDRKCIENYDQQKPSLDEMIASAESIFKDKKRDTDARLRRRRKSGFKR